jgi:hypothetical protein
MRNLSWIAVGLVSAACGRSPLNPYYAETTGGSVGTSAASSGTSAGSGTSASAGTSATSGTAVGTSGTVGSTSGTTGSSGAACTSSSDCPLLNTACSGGLCQSISCSPVPSAGGGGGVGAPCLMADNTFGSCLFFDTANGFYCVVPGTVQGTPGTLSGPCSETATRAALGSACSAGFGCGLSPASPLCAQECDPEIGPSDGCGDDPSVVCAASTLNAQVGYCEAGSDNGSSIGTGTTGGTQGTGGTTGTGTGGTTSGTGTTSGSSSGGTCLPEFTPCDSSSGPACCSTMACVYEPLRGGDVCEFPCTTTSECPSPYTVCTGTSCTVNICGVAIGGPPNGSLDGTCNAEGTNDGTCVGAEAPDGGAFGLCYQGGTATGSGCSIPGSRNNPGGLCEAGYFCGPSIAGGLGTECYFLCDPSSPDAGAHCESQGYSSCFQVPMDPGVGFCQ